MKNKALKMIPPFFPNFQGTRCWQASLRSILEYFEPDTSWTWEELDELTGKDPESGTWPMKTGAEFSERGYDVLYIEPFDCAAFAKNPEEYMRENFSAELFEYSMQWDVSKIQEHAKQFLSSENVCMEDRNSTIQDITDYLDAGYLIICWINSCALHDEEGMSGHFICIYDYTDDAVICHDNGGKSVKEQVPALQIPFDKLMRISTDEGNTCGLYAFRLKEETA